MIEGMKQRLRQRGFTMIELLVAISIIGILISVLVVSFDGARNSSRDKAMQAELKELQLAIELYRAQNGAFPVPETAGTCGDPFSAEPYGTDSTCPIDYIQGLVPEFVPSLPSVADSANSNCEIEYRTAADQSWYKLTAIACIAGDERLTHNSELARCPSTCPINNSGDRCHAPDEVFQTSFAVYSAGGQCE